MAKTVKSRGVIDVLESGDIYIETGYKGNLVTQLGTNTSGDFKPYGSKYHDLTCYYPYKFNKSDIPAYFDKVDTFVSAMREQADSNEYIVSYATIGAKALKVFLKENLLDDNRVKYVLIDNFSNLSYLYYKQFNNTDDIIQIAIKTENFENGLELASDAPDEVVKVYEPLLSQMNREDRHYTMTDLQIKPSDYKYFNGFISFNSDDYSNLSGYEVVLITDFVENMHTLTEAQRKLKSIGASVLFSVALAKINTK